MPVINEYFEKYIFPNINTFNKVPSESYDTASKLKAIILSGDIGSGKSTLARKFSEIAVNKYGIENVNSIISTNIEDAVLYGLDNKLVQLQIIEDFTLKKETNEMVRLYLQIRKIWKNIYNKPNGLIISIFNLHRFHSSIKEIRGTSKAFIARTDSLSEYDHNFINRMLQLEGSDSLKVLEEAETIGNIEELKNYSLCRTRTGVIGLLNYPPPQINYVVDVNVLKEKYTFVDQLFRRKEILFDMNNKS